MPLRLGANAWFGEDSGARVALALRPRPRTFLAHQAIKVAEKWLDRRLLAVDYPPRHLTPRYGHGRPPHPRLHELIAAEDDRYRKNLKAIGGYEPDLRRIASSSDDPDAPQWRNRWLPAIDAAAIYGFLRERAPRSYIEVGAGMSTRFARRAVDDGGLSTRITSIDPLPRSDVDHLCDRRIDLPLEEVDPIVFEKLREGDVLFMDGSHRALMNSDATVFFLDVLPSLPSDVLVGVHDVLLPDDYLPMWVGYHWSEQYLMAAYLLAEGDKVQLELASRWVTEYSDAHEILAPLLGAPELERADHWGFALWLTTTDR